MKNKLLERAFNLIQNLNDDIFRKEVETHLEKFIKEVSNIDTRSNYRVLFSVRIVNQDTGNVIDLERS